MPELDIGDQVEIERIIEKLKDLESNYYTDVIIPSRIRSAKWELEKMLKELQEYKLNYDR